VTFQKIFIAVCLILCMSVVRPSAAQDSTQDVPAADADKKGFASKFKDPDDGWFDASQWLVENIVGFMPVPIIITEPAVDNGLGMAGRRMARI